MLDGVPMMFRWCPDGAPMVPRWCLDCFHVASHVQDVTGAQGKPLHALRPHRGAGGCGANEGHDPRHHSSIVCARMRKRLLEPISLEHVSNLRRLSCDVAGCRGGAL
eukprot:3987303-Pyramimonas_sp.AAC.1